MCFWYAIGKGKRVKRKIYKATCCHTWKVYEVLWVGGWRKKKIRRGWSVDGNEKPRTQRTMEIMKCHSFVSGCLFADYFILTTHIAISPLVPGHSCVSMASTTQLLPKQFAVQFLKQNVEDSLSENFHSYSAPSTLSARFLVWIFFLFQLKWINIFSCYKLCTYVCIKFPLKWYAGKGRAKYTAGTFGDCITGLKRIKSHVMSPTS